MAGRVARKMEAACLERKVVWDLVRFVQALLRGLGETELPCSPSGLQEVPRGMAQGLETEFWTQKDVTVGTQPKLRGKSPHP